MSGFQRKETWNVVPISDDDDSSNKLVIDEVDSSPETPLDLPVRKRLTGFNEDDSECSKSEVEVVRQSPEMPEQCDQQKDIPKDLSGRKRPIGVDEDQHSDSTKTGNENPEMPEKRDIPPGRDGRMPRREIRNPSGHVHSAERPRMEGNGVGIARPSTSNTFSTNYDLPGTSFVFSTKFFRGCCSRDFPTLKRKVEKERLELSRTTLIYQRQDEMRIQKYQSKGAFHQNCQVKIGECLENFGILLDMSTHRKYQGWRIIGSALLSRRQVVILLLNMICLELCSVRMDPRIKI
ncbi:Hypothetical predicted protein [Cloeon dipterum]|uniref:Uncharacterized protein n=1 Tax=Cloeon dipterum TaxID=197152 RepID=A0A8S1CF57_9INSE|nr:Hypothetical predicted protein [Cloeon dipterum]